MHSRQLDQLARERNAERDAQAARAHATRAAMNPDATDPRRIRSQTGWAIVSLGLRIAESGNR